MFRLAKLNIYAPTFTQIRGYKQTHYEVLKIHPDSTTEQIKEAFINLSKKFHPDVKGAKSDAKLTEQFVKISEAYQVLSKKSTRDAYDVNIGNRAMYEVTYETGNKTEYYRPWSTNPMSTEPPNPNGYYGVKGVTKVSNTRIMTFLILYGVIGAIIGFCSIRKSFNIHKSQMDDASAVASAHHASVRKNAEQYGNETQIKRLVNKFGSSSNS